MLLKDMVYLRPRMLTKLQVTQAIVIHTLAGYSGLGRSDKRRTEQ